MEAVSFPLQTTVVWLFSTITTDSKPSKGGTERVWVGATVMEGVERVPGRSHSYQGTERQRLCPIWIYRLLNLDWLKNLSLGKLVIWIAVETGEYSNKEISFIYSALLAKICMLPLKNLNFKGQTLTH